MNIATADAAGANAVPVSDDNRRALIIDGLPWRFAAFPDGLAADGWSVSEAGPDIWAGGGPATRAAIGDRPCHLVGISKGAALAACHAAQSPGLVLSLTLVAPLILLPVCRRHTADLFAHPDAAALPAGALDIVHDTARRFTLGAFNDDYIEGMLPQIRCPTLVVFGGDDRLASARGPARYKELIPNCSLAFVYDAGHAVAAERPDALRRLVSDFLRRRETFIVSDRSAVINP